MKHTLKNIRRTGEFVVNLVDEGIAEAMNITATEFPPEESEPVMAGQVVPLSGFESGQYRLDVQVTDLLSGKSVSRDVSFTVGS